MANRACFIWVVWPVFGVCAWSRVAAQPVFSIDFQGPSISLPDSAYGVAITEGDLLVASSGGVAGVGPLAAPRIAVFGGAPSPGGLHLALPTYAAAVGHSPGVPGAVEVDALSFGTDFLLNPDPPFGGVWTFSVDEFAQALALGVGSPPNLLTEGSVGNGEACADVLGGFGPGDYTPGPLPFTPVTIPAPRNALLIDGDGDAPPATSHPFLTAVYALGLVEPNPPTSPPGPPDALPDLGDNVDALDVDTRPVGSGLPFPIYFSLDSAFTDPLETPAPSGLGPVNSGSAAANGFSGADVLVTLSPGTVPIVYASANSLGLDYLGGPDSDDLDALALWENGVPGYQPSINPLPPYDWGPGGADLLLFSVRRGSAVIGMPDSITGTPIEEGDILVPPFGGGPALPGVFIAAENLGLLTIRTAGIAPADDLDALDVSPDCNGNVVPDVLDIAWGQSEDCNANGIPDACETLCGDLFCCPLENACLCPADCGSPVPSEVPGSTCADEADNDCDGPFDCADPDCAADLACLCGNEECDPQENPCNCPADCGPPDAAESTGTTCTDGLDNDCDGPIDCADADCAGDPLCGCFSDDDCDDGLICTCDMCNMGACTYIPRAFADLDCSGGMPDVDDILCSLGGFIKPATCPQADLAPPCTGNGIMDVDDILTMLDAFVGFDPCGCK